MDVYWTTIYIIQTSEGQSDLFEVAIFPAAESRKPLYPAANPSLL